MAIDIGRGILRIAPDYTELQTSLNTQLPGMLQAAGKSSLILGAQLTAALTAPITLLGKQATDAAISFENGLAGVAKTVGDVTEVYAPSIVALGDQLTGLANKTPIAVESLLRISEIAGQLGIDAENIPEFADKVAQLAISTDLTTEAAAFSLARFSNVLGTEAAGAIDGYADSLVALGNALPTTESAILSLASRVAGAGAAVGITGEDILALSAALSSVGVSAELGGTAISRVLVAIAKEVDTGGDKLAKFAQVAGQTAEQFTETWRSSPTEALRLFIAGLGRLQEQGSGIFQVLDDLGFSAVRVSQVLLKAAGGADLFTNALDISRNSTGALNREFGKFASITSSKILVAQNNIRDAFKQIGDSALPIMAKVFGAFGGLAQKVASIDGPLKSFLGVFVSIAALAGPVLTMFGGVLQGLATIALLRARHKEAAIAAEAQASAEWSLAKALEAVSVAAGTAGTSVAKATATAGAAGAAASGFSLTGVAQQSGGAIGAAGLAIGTTFRRSAMQKFGQKVKGYFLKNLKPSFKTIGKGLGVSLGLGIADTVVQSIDTEEDTVLDTIKGVVHAGLSGASLGAIGGSIIPGLGTGLGAALGAAVGIGLDIFKKKTADEVPAQITTAIEDNVAENPIEPEIDPIQLAFDFATSVDLNPAETIDPVLDEFKKRMQDIAVGLYNIANAFGEQTMPSIFARMFDPQMVKEAAKNLDFSDLQKTVAENLADLEEIDSVVRDLVGRGMTGLAQQLVETGGPQALAAARTIREQLLTDPKSVFQLETDIERLKPGLAASIQDLFTFPETFGPTGLSDIQTRLLESGLLGPDDQAALQSKYQENVQSNIDVIVQGLKIRPDIAERLAITVTDPLKQALLDSLAGVAIAAQGEASLGSEEDLQGLVTAALNKVDFTQLLETALSEKSFQEPIRITSPTTGEVFVFNADDLKDAANQDLLRALTGNEGFIGPIAPLTPEQKIKVLGGEDLLDLDVLTADVVTQLTLWAREKLPAALAEEGKAFTVQEKAQFIIDSLFGEAPLIAADVLNKALFGEDSSVSIDFNGVDFVASGVPKLDVDNIDWNEVWSNLSIPNVKLDYKGRPINIRWAEGSLNVDESTLNDVGSNIVDGVRGGIDENWETFSTNVSRKLQELPNTMNTAIEAGSPARLFVPVGENIVAGINAGLNESNVGEEFLLDLQALVAQANELGVQAGLNFQMGVESVLSGTQPLYRIPNRIPSASKTVNNSMTIVNPTTVDINRDTDRLLGVLNTAGLIE